ncbi:MAG TPA: hypothetical protein VMW42_02215 [Desulfatiglandales bacterium]|nr:hypothetical protein [Desulfatiglandales bacterium]
MVKILYILSSTGQRTALLNGAPSERKQTLEVPCSHPLYSDAVRLSCIDDDGNGIIDMQYPNGHYGFTSTFYPYRDAYRIEIPNNADAIRLARHDLNNTFADAPGRKYGNPRLDRIVALYPEWDYNPSIEALLASEKEMPRLIQAIVDSEIEKVEKEKAKEKDEKSIFSVSPFVEIGSLVSPIFYGTQALLAWIKQLTSLVAGSAYERSRRMFIKKSTLDLPESIDKINDYLNNELEDVIKERQVKYSKTEETENTKEDIALDIIHRH